MCCGVMDIGIGLEIESRVRISAGFIAFTYTQIDLVKVCIPLTYTSMVWKNGFCSWGDKCWKINHFGGMCNFKKKKKSRDSMGVFSINNIKKNKEKAQDLL